jgi:hypothetical protein
MRRYLIILAALLSLFSPAAQAANSTVSAMTAASALGGTELVYIVQGAADRKGTPAQFATYIYGLASGDCTISGVGAVVCTKTNGVAFGALATVTPGTGIASWLATPSSANLAAALTDETGSGAAVFGTAPTISSLNMTVAATLAYITGSTQCLQVNTSGAISGTGAACGGSGSTGANPTATAGPTANNGVATTFMRSDASPAIQLGSASQKGVVQVDGTTITATGGVISAVAGGTGTVTSVSAGCGVSTSPNPITTTGTVAALATVNPQTGANYAIVSGDCGKLVNLSNAANQIPTLPIASTTGAGWFAQVCNQGAGTQTITPTTSTIGGASTFVLPAGSAAAPQCVTIVSDGTNYQVAPDFTRNAAITIASGTAVLGTSAIASAACATVVTVGATNVATTDVLTASFNGDPTAVTGYTPVTTGALTIFPYPTSGNVNFKVCNLTSASITPGAITLNWRVTR